MKSASPQMPESIEKANALILQQYRQLENQAQRILDLHYEVKRWRDAYEALRGEAGDEG